MTSVGFILCAGSQVGVLPVRATVAPPERVVAAAARRGGRGDGCAAAAGPVSAEAGHEDLSRPQAQSGTGARSSKHFKRIHFARF